jgi:hypothetical protein
MLSGQADPSWTIGALDQPRIATRVTDGTGCADIELPAESDLLVTATKPDWVPSAMTVRIGTTDPPAMRAVLLQGFSGLPAWWWDVTEAQVCAPSEGQQGIVGLAVYDRSDWIDHERATPLAGIEAVLTGDGTGTRTDWLYVSNDCNNYCNTRACEAATSVTPTGVGVIGRLPPGLVEIEIPGVTCAVAPGESTFSWPVAGSTNRIRMDVRPGFFSIALALCERGEP